MTKVREKWQRRSTYVRTLKKKKGKGKTLRSLGVGVKVRHPELLGEREEGVG